MASADKAHALVSCSGVPHNEGGPTGEPWTFDVDTATCTPGVTYVNGFRVFTDDDKFAPNGVKNSVGSSFSSCTTTVDNTTEIDDLAFDVYDLCDSGGGARYDGANGETYNFTMVLVGGTDGITYTVKATIIATDGSNHQVTSMTVSGGVFGDATNGPEAADTVAGFLSDRMSNIVSNLPDLTGFLDGVFGGAAGGGGSPFTFAFGGATDPQGRTNYALSFATSRNRFAAAFDPEGEAARFASAFAETPTRTEAAGAVAAYGAGGPDDMAALDRVYDIWTDVSGAHAETSTASSDLWIATVGAHRFVSKDVIVGLFVQGDYARAANASGSSADGVGYMAGPYMAARIGEHLRVEARGGVGQSFNTITPTSGGAADSFQTIRWLAQAKASGSLMVGRIRVAPTVQVAYFEEDQASYVDSSSATVAAQVISKGELRFGPNFSHTFEGANGGTLTPSVGVEGAWNFAVRDGATSQGTLAGTEALRARVNAGLAIGAPSGFSVSAGGYYDGLGIAGYDAYGGNLRVSVPLN